MYDKPLDYCTMEGLNKVTQFILGIKEYEKGFDVNKFLKNVQGFGTYFSDNPEGTKEKIADDINFFSKNINIYALIEKGLIDDAYKITSAFTAEENKKFNDSIRKLVDIYGTDTYRFVWVKSKTIDEAKEKVRLNSKEFITNLFEMMISNAKKIESEIKDFDNLDETEEAFTNEANIVTDTMLSIGILHAIDELNNNVTDRLLLKLSPQVRMMIVKMIETMALESMLESDSKKVENKDE